MIYRKLIYIPFILLLFSACSQKESYESRPLNGNAIFQVRMTDYPALYDAILIDIQEVHVHSNSIGWQEMQTNEGIYDLLQLTNGTDTVIAEDHLPTGTISQIRFVLGSQNQIVIEGDTLPLIVPSGATSGLKLNLHYELMPGISYSVLIDFDASQSILKTGNNDYKLKPVLRVVAVGTDGSIQGQVSPQAFALIYAIEESSYDTTGTFTNEEGKFMIYGLDEGYYRLEVWPEENYPMKTLEDVLVINGVITDLGIIAL